MIPTTEAALWVNHLFRRKPSTHWAEKEVAQYRKLIKAKFFESCEDRELIEQYYAFERKKGPKGFHRRDLYTFLNNAISELDRAREWREEYPLKPPPRKIIPMPAAQGKPYAAPTDPQEVALIQRFEEEFRQHKQRNRIL